MSVLVAGLLSAAAQAASPTRAAADRLAAFGGSTAHYVKETTGEPAMDVTYRAPDDATVQVFSPDGVFTMSVNAHHLHLRVKDACARLEVLPLLQSAEAAGMGHFRPEGTPAPRLSYRITDGQVNLSAEVVYAAEPALFSWLSDLSAPGTEVQAVDGVWRATAGGASWEVSQDSGLLVRLAAGDKAIRLSSVTRAPKPGKAKNTLPYAAEVCPTSTDKALAYQLESQLRLQLYQGVLETLLAAWAGMDADRRQEAAQQQEVFWRALLAVELSLWAEGLGQGSWSAQVIEAMADPAAFNAFLLELPLAERGAAIQHWEQAWFAQVGQDLVRAHAQDLEAAVFGGLAAQGVSVQDPAVLSVLVSQPLLAAALAEAEGPLQAVLVPVIQAGSAALQARLDL